nr:hypothetical protein [Kofleriaceae bacterium]
TGQGRCWRLGRAALIDQRTEGSAKTRDDAPVWEAHGRGSARLSEAPRLEAVAPPRMVGPDLVWHLRTAPTPGIAAHDFRLQGGRAGRQLRGT